MMKEKIDKINEELEAINWLLKGNVDRGEAQKLGARRDALYKRRKLLNSNNIAGLKRLDKKEFIQDHSSC